MDNLIEESLNEIILLANEGISYNGATIKFHTLESFSLNSSYNDNVPILVIRNKKEIINKLKQYIELVIAVKKLEVNKSSIKKSIISLFSYACYEDYSMPSKFIENHISFYLNDEFMKNDKIISNLVIKKQIAPLSNPLPYIFKMYIKDNDKKYYLPSIFYGISLDTCYIYSISKSINKDDKKPLFDDNIKALIYFLHEIYNYGISKIKVISCMPMQKTNENELNLLEEFIKISYLYDNINITSSPFEIDEYMNIKVSEFECIDYDLDNNKLKSSTKAM